ncbi:hypothetical protein [Okeania sp. SIO2C2]|uniref:hypothetical protein n=1 Tax=Okeania sp. SIO2C2 TaxID=2607787 RepID=UPI00257C3208|nr:hypothetical protein [Okeania sp. SIO2C2]
MMIRVRTDSIFVRRQVLVTTSKNGSNISFLLNWEWYEKNGDLNFPKAEDYTPEQIADMKARLDPMLTAVPPQGTNTVIVGHDDLFEASTGIYPDPMGIAYVVKPDGSGNFELIANVLPDEWLKLGGS